jgi:hypothetical protein
VKSHFISVAYRNPVWVALLTQLPLLLLFSILLDGDHLFKISATAAAGFWVGVSLIMVRRPRNPRTEDLKYIRLGYFPLLAIAVMLTIILSGVFGYL